MDAAAIFARWLPAFYAARRFPVFLMWESDALSTLGDRLGDLARGVPVPSAGTVDTVERWWNARLEALFAPAGTALWDEMKQNAQAISADADSGGRILFDALRASPVLARHPVRIHLVGHSAGAIALAYLIDRIAAQEWDFESVTFLAPALRVDRFEERVLPWLEAGRIRRLREYQLSDAAELQDPTLRPLLGYGHSMLYLVSRSFEGGGRVPILGMERYFPAAVAKMARVKVLTAPSPATRCTTHGGFDADDATMASVISGMDR